MKLFSPENESKSEFNSFEIYLFMLSHLAEIGRTISLSHCLYKKKAPYRNIQWSIVPNIGSLVSSTIFKTEDYTAIWSHNNRYGLI
jgi:hypothetical protein